MRIDPIKIGITGTHSTGKSSFLSIIEAELAGKGLKIERIGDFATRAKELGFPILRDHNYHSTIWILTECMRLEAEASLRSDVILVDRPVPDALGYLRAALEVSNRSIGNRRMQELVAIVSGHTPEYDILIKTYLDQSVELGEGRDEDRVFRAAAAAHIDAVMKEFAPRADVLTSSNQRELADGVVRRVRMMRSDIVTK